MRIGKRLYSLLLFLGVSVLGGMLTAGLIIPAASLVSAGGVTLAEGLEELPTELETPPQSERSRLVMSDGTTLAYFYDQNRVYKSMDKIAEVMQQAQVAIEDHRFYEHGAIDLEGTLRALVRTSQGNTQGGSTLTQQYVRLVQVYTAEQNNDTEAQARATENTIERKIRELRYAIAVEKKFSKDTILERYLNIAYYGDGAYGVEAAARHYFGVSAAKLDLAQAAMLAGLVRNPVATNPVKYPQVAIQRRNDVINRMIELGIVTKEEGEAAKATDFDQDKVRDYRVGCANSKFPFVCDYAERVLIQQTTSLGATETERRNRLYRGGLTIQTMIDPDAQKSAEKVLSKFLDARDPAVAVIAMIEPGTGQIVTMAQSRPDMGNNRKKGETFFNYAVANDMGGAEGFQGGSTFKAFVAAAALEEGLGAYDRKSVKSVMDFTGKSYKACDGYFPSPKWRVAGSGGTYNLFTGTAGSVNGYFAQLEQPILCESVTMADRLGLEISKKQDGKGLVEYYQYIPSFTLGAVEITPLSMVEAYATFAARGIHCEPVILKSIENPDGVTYDVPDANCKRVLSEEVADAMNKIFQGPYRSGTARPAQVAGLQMAGKTGTVSDNKAIWTVGYTSTLAAAAVISWDSNPYYAKYWKNRKSIYIKGAYMKYSGRTLWGLSGYEAGGQLLKPAFSAAMKDRKKGSFVEPPASVLKGEQVSVPSCSGMGVASCRSRLEKAGFSTYVSQVESDASKGSLVGTSPSGSAAKYGSIGILVSKGPKKKDPEPEDAEPADPGETP